MFVHFVSQQSEDAGIGVLKTEDTVSSQQPTAVSSQQLPDIVLQSPSLASSSTSSLPAASPEQPESKL